MPDSAARSGPAKENFSTELFLDNTFIEETPGVFRRLHPPRKHRLNPVVRCDRWWENTYAQPYCTMYDAEAKLFKMWMRSGSDQKTGYVDGYAGYTTYLTSTDGIHWDKPALGVLEIAGRRDHNIVFTGFEPDTKTQPRQKGVVIPNAQRYQGKKGWLWSQVRSSNTPWTMLKGAGDEDLRLVANLIRLVRRERINLIHAHEFYMNAVCAVVAPQNPTAAAARRLRVRRRCSPAHDL